MTAPRCRPLLVRFDFRHAVVEHAVVYGWHASLMPRNARSAARPWMPRWPDLTLVRPSDRRLILALLLGDTTSRSRTKDFLDLFAGLRWDPAKGERQRAELGTGGIVPSVETFVWRPTDLLDGSVDEALR